MKGDARQSRVSSMRDTASDDIVREMRTAGAPYREIAERLGTTRNAVAGRCQRMGLCQTPAEREAAARALDERIRDAVLAGGSNSEVARQLGIAESTVSGRANLLGVGGRHRKTERRTVTVRKPTPVPVQKSASALVPVPERAPDASNNVLFMNASGCRYALWSADEHDVENKMVCGATVERGAYCDFHARLAYRSVETRRAA